MSSGITQEALAERAGLHPTYIGLIERGRRNPTLEVCEQLAQALDCKLPTLVAEASKPVTKNLE